MKILIASAVGSGPTPLGAFDDALRRTGVENYNLIPLSSVIPTGGELERGRFDSRVSEYGHRLYVVMAREEVSEAGQQAWAGLGWTQEAGTGRGLFVECHGSSREQVQRDIHATLDSMKRARPYEYGKNESEIVGAVCDGTPICALAIAVYSSEPWSR
jgi:arginine decarboxylase